MADQITGASLLAMRSLAAQATDSAITTQVNMEALISNYVALQAENLKLRDPSRNPPALAVGRFNNEKPQDTATPTSAASWLSAGLDRLGKRAWTRSTVEEVISALWMIAAITSFGFNFDAIGWILAIKSISDMCASIWFGWRESVASKRQGKE
jgi:tryptophanyl-tRNA synthetase